MLLAPYLSSNAFASLYNRFGMQMMLRLVDLYNTGGTCWEKSVQNLDILIANLQPRLNLLSMKTMFYATDVFQEEIIQSQKRRHLGTTLG